MAKWYIEQAGRIRGPVRSSELRRLAARGELSPNDRLRKVGGKSWARAGQVVGLFPEPGPAEGSDEFDFLNPSTTKLTPDLAVFDFAGEQPTAREPKPPETAPTGDDQVGVGAAIESHETDGPATVKLDEAQEIGLQTVATLKVDDSRTTPAVSGDSFTGVAAERSSRGVRALGGRTTLTLEAHWLRSVTVRNDGRTNEVYLPLGSIDAASITEARLGEMAVRLLTVSAGRTSVTVGFVGDRGPARVFVEQVLSRCV